MNNKHIYKSRRKISFTGIFCLLFLFSSAFGMLQTPMVSNQEKQPKKIVMEHADTVSFNRDINENIHVAKGNVVFQHDSAYMYCDSAYLYNESNMLEAFSNVEIIQGDSIFIYGDYLIYEGNLNLAKMRYNVRMESGNSTLFTDSLNYDRNVNIGYFLEGGLLVDSLNELTSLYGQYSPDTKLAHFQKDVVLTNPEFILTSDTLMYSTETKIATILGPSVIESDSGTVYSTLGWYNTETEFSMLYDRSLVVSKDGYKTIVADSLAYDRLTGFSEAFGNMVLNDTLQKIILTGNYGYLDQLTDYAFATDSAQFIEYSQGDSLFLHADTLKLITLGNEKEIKAYYGVRFYREDMQGVCDSLQYNTKDSTLYLHKDPILWNSVYQITGDTIIIFFNDSTIDRAHVKNYAFAMEEVDTTYFNQLKGKNMYIYFQDGEIRLIDVNGNAETIFYPSEEDGAFIGLNKTESSFFSMYIKDRKPERTKIDPKAKGQTIPIPDLTPETKYLKDFKNFEYLRPKDKYDIFVKKQRRSEDVTPPRTVRSRE